MPKKPLTRAEREALVAKKYAERVKAQKVDPAKKAAMDELERRRRAAAAGKKKPGAKPAPKSPRAKLLEALGSKEENW